MTGAAAGGSDTAALVLALLVLLTPFAAAGLALINTGLGRSRSAAHAMLSSLCALAVAVLVYFVWGFAWQGLAGGPARVISTAGRQWNWIGSGPWFLSGMDLNGSPASFVLWLGMFTAGVAALIPLGAGADRWRLGPTCCSTVLLAGITYPLFAHWTWGGGWLAQLGVHSGLGRGFLDAGGSGSVHAVGGLSALSIAWILGPRRGKYSRDGLPAAIPGHNAVLVLFACFLALVGWFGLNGAGAMLFCAAPWGRVVLVAVNTSLSAAAAGLAAATITRVRFGRPDASLCANGWVAGLVASSAGCAFFAPAAAALVGLVAGGVVTFSVEWLDLHLRLDDPAGSISVHAVGGLWGILALGFFGRIPSGWVLNGVTGPAGDSGQWLAQIVGVATLLGFVLPMAYGLNWLLNRFFPQRVSAEGEHHGMDLHELGAGAYPEFVVHGEDFTLR